MVSLSRQQLTALWLGLAFFVVAYLWDNLFSNESNFLRYKNTIEKNLHETEREANLLLEDTAFHERILRGANLGTRFDKDLERVDSLRKKSFNFCIFKDSALIFWTQNDILPQAKDFKQNQPIKTHSSFVRYKESCFELRYYHAKQNEDKKYTAAVLIPLKKNYAPFEGQYLESHFAASKAIPTDLNLVDSGHIDRFAIKTLDNKTLCYVDSTEPQADFIHDIGMVICLAIGFFLLGVFGDHIAKQMLRQYQSPLVGTMFFFSVMVIMRLCVLWLQHSALLPYMDLKLGGFNEGVFVTSLAELLINTSFLFWLSIFFNSEFRLPSHADSPAWKRWLLASAFYSVIVLLLILCIGIFNDLVVNWHDLLTFNELSDFNVRSILALFGIGIILLSVFLITHRLILSITDLMLNRVQHFFALDVAILVGTFYFEAYNLNLPTWMYVLFIFIYVIMFYQFIGTKRPGLIWLLLWVVVFSAIQSFFIARFNVEKDKETLESYAIYLSSERDTVAERRIKLMTDRIENNTFIQTLIATPLRVAVDPERIAGIIKSYYDEEDYLSNQYGFSFSCFLRNSESLIPGDSITLSSLRHQYEKGDFTDKNGKVRFWTNKEGDFAYMALATVRAAKDNPMYVALQFKRQDKLSSRVLTELFVDKHYKSIPRLNEYTYAIYKKGVCVEQNQAGIYDGVINDADVLGQTIRKHEQIGNKDEFLFKNTEGVVVKISKPRAISSQGKLLTMYIILSLTSLLILLTLLNHFIAFLPDVINLRFAFSLNSSLRNRIIFPSIAFILLSYTAIFYFTVEYYKDIDAKYYEQDVETKSNTIVDNAINQIKDTNVKIEPNSGSVLNDLLSRYAQTYQNAMHLYTPEGILAATTEPNLFDKGIMSKNMNTSAYYHLKLAENKIFKTDENIGNFHYKTSFYTVRDSSKQLLGFLELPYYSRDRNIRMGISDVWTHNATILTLLFLLGICIIYIQAANIVKPLQAIADSIRRLSLGSETKNELITTWNQNDEIRVLIDDYNNKVVELEESFSKLAEAEREMAWREMAKQVAHEIRNPLTPIKLSVQHLEMIRRQGSDNLEVYLARTNKILLDQIDNLEKIVSEFANFAKMPQKATNELFVFNDLVASVGGLFAQKEEGKQIDFSLSVSEERFLVYADRTLLTSALNNLIKNAIQAIPDSNDGLVRVSLYRRQNTAVLRISDNGTGIPKEIQDKIFSPNFTTKAYGSGIGLLITKNIVQSVNGKIYFQSTENEGTDFYIELEIHKIESDDTGENSSKLVFNIGS